MSLQTALSMARQHSVNARATCGETVFTAQVNNFASDEKSSMSRQNGKLQINWTEFFKIV